LNETYCISGINAKEQPHINVDLWLDPNSPQYNKTLADAVFHYSARDSQEERFEICISTDEMKEAAWKYGYQSQIMLDGTFGICDKRVLLFIIMGVDGNRRGVPLAFLLFSAPSGNKHTAAGYDTAILAKLLKEWRSSLEAYRGGKSFYALVATTDTDLKERGALLIAIPELLLLICRTHLRRSWKNHRMKVLKGKTPAIALVSTRLRSLEDALVKTTSIDAARSLIADEVLALEAMKAEEISEAAAHGGLEHLRYLSDYWLSTKDLWASWSDFGRHAAARVLGCSFEEVIPTTNHLESFNGLFKRKYVRAVERWPPPAIGHPCQVFDCRHATGNI
jgi:hypothetical protein